MTNGSGKHRLYSPLMALGAIALVFLFVGAAILRAPAAAKADPEYCVTDGLQDFYNDYPTTGNIGIGMQILCYGYTGQAVSVTVSGGYWIQHYLPLSNTWQDDTADGISGSGKAHYTFVRYVACYDSLPSSWKYRGLAHFWVKFPDGVIENYWPTTDTRTISCLPAGEGGGGK